MNESDSTSVVMIVDDEPENLNILDEILRLEGGWSVRAFARADQAFAAARLQPPDLVLLDICMPGMDGYELCRLFKADETLKTIPIVFLSAFSATSEKVCAFEAGGVDYITKPFAEREVLARVRAQLRLRRYQRNLESLVRERMAELAEAHRRLRIWNNAKNGWIDTLSHELRTPLTGVFGVAELLIDTLPQDSENQRLKRAYAESRERIDKLMDDADTLVAIDVCADTFLFYPTSVGDCLHAALADTRQMTYAGDIRGDIQLSEEVLVLANCDLLQRAFADLIQTALHCSCDNGLVSLEAYCDPPDVFLTLTTWGKGLDAEEIALFFEVGGQRNLLRKGGDFGLGTALAYRIVRLFNGHVTVCNGTLGGLVLHVRLPAHADEKPPETHAAERPPSGQ